MTARYQVILRNHAGAQVALITEWLSLEYTVRLNDVGDYTLELDGDAAVVAEFAPTAEPVDRVVEIRRRDIDASPTIDWYTDFAAFHRTSAELTNDSGRAIFASLGVDFKHLLARRAILYRDLDPGADKTGLGETVMKAYVNENAGVLATLANGRIFDGVFPGVTVEVTAGGGSAWEGTKAYRPLLKTIKEISDATGVDFDMIQTTPTTYAFRAELEPLGLDRTTVDIQPNGLNGAGNAPVIFSLDHGNMEVPSLTTHRIDEVTAAIVTGQGAEGNKVVIERTSSDVTDSPFNRIETIKKANQEDALAALNAVGDATLQALQARERFTFAALQIPSTLYGRDYFVGDLVTARYKDTERNLKIITATVNVTSGREEITIEVSDVT